MRALILAAALAAFSYPPALAGSPMCGPHAAVAQALAETYGEVPFFIGHHPTLPQVYELFLNPETRSWSVVVSDPTTTCLISTGLDGVTVEQALVPPGDPS
jgi:hypothetical protein